MFRSRIYILSAMIICTVFLNACAYGDRYATLKYPPVEALSSPSDPKKAAYNPSNDIDIRLKPFTDSRYYDVVGMIRNMHGENTASVFPVNNVSEWVTMAVKTELKRNGYRVTDVTTEFTPEEESVLIAGDVQKVFSDMALYFLSTVSLKIEVSKGDNELINKYYNGYDTESLAFSGSGEEYAKTLQIALNKALKEFVEDLNTHFHTNENGK